MARLHQVLVLKSLGLSLKRIGELLTGRLADLDAVLELQQALLRSQEKKAHAALTTLARARQRIRRQPLSIDDLIALTKETAMTTENPEAFFKGMEPITRKHFTQQEIDSLDARKLEAFSGWDEESFPKAWEDLIGEARALMAADDRTSARAKEMVRRWKVMTELFTGGDRELNRKAAEVWRDALADPALAPMAPMNMELMNFVQSIAEDMKTRGELT